MQIVEHSSTTASPRRKSRKEKSTQPSAVDKRALVDEFGRAHAAHAVATRELDAAKALIRALGCGEHVGRIFVCKVTQDEAAERLDLDAIRRDMSEDWIKKYTVRGKVPEKKVALSRGTTVEEAAR
jgi:hypothetical protein